jgi:membrane protein insertase Oxa1/YidC/SpoIIIJ
VDSLDQRSVGEGSHVRAADPHDGHDVHSDVHHATTADPMQRKIFLAMPLVFGIMFKEFPSGLVLYWLVQNVLTIIQQLIMNKWWKDHPADGAKAT